MWIERISERDDVQRENLIKRWEPIFKMLPISREYWYDLAEFSQKYEYDTKELFPALPITLKILSKLDLSKVMLTDFHEMCRPVRVIAKISMGQLHDIETKTGIDVILALESGLIEQMSLCLKEQIDNEGGILISRYFNTVLDQTDLSDCKIVMTGHMMMFNMYRVKKLKRLKSVINDKRKHNRVS